MLASRILITGAGGFVGGHLARALAERGATVEGLGPEPAAPPGSRFGAWHVADVCDTDGCAAAVAAARPDALIHLAGQSSAARSFEDPAGTFRLNVLGTRGVLEAVRRAAPGARVLAIGSGEAYGPQREGSRVAEDAPFRPVSPYAFSKAASDALAAAFGGAHGLDVVRTRSFAHAGPGQAPRFALPSWADQIAAAERGEAEPVIRVGNLDVTRDLADVRDVARAYAALIERGRRGEAYNVARGEGVRLSEVVRRLAAMARVPVRIEVDPARVRPADVPWLVADVTRLREHTGWAPAVPLDETLASVLDAARERSGDR